MSRPVVLDPEAQAEFDDGYDFYEARRVGLGGAFADAVEAVVCGIRATPGMHAAVFGGRWCVGFRTASTTWKNRPRCA
jgi:hypothetical protein